MNKYNKLELVWAGKDAKTSPEPRVLIEDKEKSYKVDEANGNILIHGDNLLGLKSIENEYAGKVKCIYIDPPYNTGNAFEHYEDGFEHSIWLGLMRDRLEILRNLLTDDGMIFIQIDNNEMSYLKVLMDEVFGRKNFINDIIWKRRGGSANPKNRLNNVTDFILWYSKSDNYTVNHIYSKDDEKTKEYIEKRFNNIDENGRKFMKSPIQSPNLRENLIYDYKGYKTPKKGYSISRKLMEEWDKQGKLCFPKKKDQNINRKIYLDEYKGQPVSNLWTDITVINPMSKERSSFEGGQKPEALIKRCIEFSTQEGDIVLDSFAGSGTTGAVAHKMGRRWIMIEMGDHCYTHIIPRLTKVIDGEDQGGISKAVDWKGGGGFKFYELASSLIEKDFTDTEVISNKYNGDMLAEAMCKIMGYKYKPSKEIFFKQGVSSEKNFIFTTTITMTEQYLSQIKDKLGDDNLLICAGAFIGNPKGHGNITIKKIPKAILDKCEWNKPGYPLPVREDFTDDDFEFDDGEE